MSSEYVEIVRRTHAAFNGLRDMNWDDMQEASVPRASLREPARRMSRI